jgi:RNA polymerase sigma factor (TIGR02999 family)
MTSSHHEPPPDSSSDSDAVDAEGRGTLFAALYDELRQIARRELRRGAGLTVSPTTLLHEAYFRIQHRDGVAFPDRNTFLAYASRVMRNLVIDFARQRQAQKRGGAFEITSLSSEQPDALVEAAELERLGDAIEELRVVDPALAELVDLKFFCGFSLVEIAAMRNVSERTAQRDWEKARILLQRALEGLELLPE